MRDFCYIGAIRNEENMTENDSVDKTAYKAVVNDEDQYSIWPAYKEIPAGWREAGREGSKEECLAYIKEVWTDMRPRSLRVQMEAGRKA